MFDQIGLLVLEGDAAGLAAKVSELSAVPDGWPTRIAVGAGACCRDRRRASIHRATTAIRAACDPRCLALSDQIERVGAYAGLRRDHRPRRALAAVLRAGARGQAPARVGRPRARARRRARAARAGRRRSSRVVAQPIVQPAAPAGAAAAGRTAAAATRSGGATPPRRRRRRPASSRGPPRRRPPAAPRRAAARAPGAAARPAPAPGAPPRRAAAAGAPPPRRAAAAAAGAGGAPPAPARAAGAPAAPAPRRRRAPRRRPRRDARGRPRRRAGAATAHAAAGAAPPGRRRPPRTPPPSPTAPAARTRTSPPRPAPSRCRRPRRRARRAAAARRATTTARLSTRPRRAHRRRRVAAVLVAASCSCVVLTGGERRAAAQRLEHRVDDAAGAPRRARRADAERRRRATTVDRRGDARSRSSTARRRPASRAASATRSRAGGFTIVSVGDNADQQIADDDRLLHRRQRARGAGRRADHGRRRERRAGRSTPTPRSAGRRRRRRDRRRRPDRLAPQQESAMAGSNEVLLVRHGETDDNAAARFQGRRDTPLNDRGREQARGARAASLRDEGLRALYSSPLRARPRDGADRRRARSAWSRSSTSASMEADTGDWSGPPRTPRSSPREPERVRALARRRPGVPLSRRRVGRPSRPQRVAGGARRRARAGPLPALVVAHGGTIRAVAGHRPPRAAAPSATARCIRLRGRRRRARPRDARRADRVRAARRARRSPRSSPRRSSRARRRASRSSRSTPFFSPNRDGRLDRARAVVRPQAHRRRHRDRRRPRRRRGARARRRPPAARRAARCASSGTGATPTAAPAPDGTYRIRLNLRRQGRAVAAAAQHRQGHARRRTCASRRSAPSATRCRGPSCCRAPTASPPRVALPGARRGRKEILVYRTDVQPGARRSSTQPIALADDATRWKWDGTVDGRRVAAGTYLVVVRARDRAGNVGSSAPRPAARCSIGRPLPGPRRHHRALPHARSRRPSRSSPATRAAVAVDSAAQRFTLDAAPRRRARDPQARPRHALARRALRGARAASRGCTSSRSARARARPRRRSSCSRAENRDVLVVLPATTWQGLQPRRRRRRRAPGHARAPGCRCGSARPFVKGGLPRAAPPHEALLLAQLDREGHRYDLTTDVALARGAGPTLAGHRGVILAGDTRWLDAARRARAAPLRARRRHAAVGRHASRCGARVTLTPRGRAIDADAADARATSSARACGRRAPASPGDARQRRRRHPALRRHRGPVRRHRRLRADARRARRRRARSPPPRRRRTADRQVIVALAAGQGPRHPAGPAGLLREPARRTPSWPALLERMWTLLARPMIAAVSTLGDLAQTAGVVVAALLGAAALLARSDRARARRRCSARSC